MIPSLNRKSYSFQKNIESTIEKYNLLQGDEGVIVGVSGGSDSVALLKVLASITMRLKLVAVYVDHGLRPDETPDEIKKVDQLCTSLNITLVVKKIAVEQFAQKEGRSIEDAARSLRYASLETVRTKYNYNKIAVGHHRDDQVEEFFLRLLRGTGTAGLSGMKPQFQNVIRPLLFQSKRSIKSYLEEQSISWSNDSSNKKTHFLRNKIRRQLLPYLAENYNPHFRKNVQNTMDILQEENSLLEDLAYTSFTLCTEIEKSNSKGEIPQTITLHLDAFTANHQALRRRILEIICWKMESRPSYSIIQDINSLAEHGVNGKEIHVKNGLRIIRHNKHLLFKKPPLPANKRGCELRSESYNISIQNPGVYPIPKTPFTVSLIEISTAEIEPKTKDVIFIDRDIIDFPLVIRGSYPGERFTANKGSGRKKISRYFNEIKLDKRKRPTWPILVHKGRVVAILGYSSDYNYGVKASTRRVLQVYVYIGETHS